MSVSKNKNFCKEKKSYCRGRFRPKPKKLNVNDEQFPTFEVVNILRSNIRDFKELCRIGSSVFKAPFPAFQAMRLKTHLDYSCESATTFIGWFACCKKLKKVSSYATHCPTVFLQQQPATSLNSLKSQFVDWWVQSKGRSSRKCPFSKSECSIKKK